MTTEEMRHHAKQLAAESDERLRVRAEELRDAMCELSLTSPHRRYVESMSALVEHERDKRAGLIDPYTGEQREAPSEMQLEIEAIQACTDLDQLKFKLRVLAGRVEGIASASKLRAGGVAQFYADDVEELAHELEELIAVLRAGKERMEKLSDKGNAR